MWGRMSIVLGTVLAAAGPVVAQDDELEIWVPVDTQFLAVDGLEGRRSTWTNMLKAPMSGNVVENVHLRRLALEPEPTERSIRFFLDPDVRGRLYRHDRRDYRFRVSGPWRDSYIGVQTGPDKDTVTHNYGFEVKKDFPVCQRPVIAPHTFAGSAVLKAQTMDGKPIERLRVFIRMTAQPDNASSHFQTRIDGEAVDRLRPVGGTAAAVSDETGTLQFDRLVEGEWKVLTGEAGSTVVKVGDRWYAWEAPLEGVITVEESGKPAAVETPIIVTPVDARLRITLLRGGPNRGEPMFATLTELTPPEGRLGVAATMGFSDLLGVQSTQSTGLRAGRYSVKIGIDGLDRRLGREFEIREGENRIEWTLPRPSGAQEVRIKCRGIADRSLSAGSKKRPIVPCFVEVRGPWTEPSVAASQPPYRWEGETLVLETVFPGDHQISLAPVVGSQASGLNEEELSAFMDAVLRAQPFTTTLKIVAGTRDYAIDLPDKAFAEKP